MVPARRCAAQCRWTSAATRPGCHPLRHKPVRPERLAVVLPLAARSDLGVRRRSLMVGRYVRRRSGGCACRFMSAPAGGVGCTNGCTASASRLLVGAAGPSPTRPSRPRSIPCSAAAAVASCGIPTGGQGPGRTSVGLHEPVAPFDGLGDSRRRARAAARSLTGALAWTCSSWADSSGSPPISKG